MTDLPEPAFPAQNTLPDVQGSSANADAVIPASVPAQTGLMNDPKILLSQTIERVESIIAKTPNDPSTRAREIGLIKAAYIKARYNVDCDVE